MARCAVCDQEMNLTRSGLVFAHKRGTERCVGSGHLPAPPNPFFIGDRVQRRGTGVSGVITEVISDTAVRVYWGAANKIRFEHKELVRDLELVPVEIWAGDPETNAKEKLWDPAGRIG